MQTTLTMRMASTWSPTIFFLNPQGRQESSFRCRYSRCQVDPHGCEVDFHVAAYELTPCIQVSCVTTSTWLRHWTQTLNTFDVSAWLVGETTPTHVGVFDLTISTED